MAIDYSEFLQPGPDGAIWWSIEIAAKLAAGYQLTDRGKEPDAPALRPTGNPSQVEVRNILSYLAQDEPPVPQPLIVAHADRRLVRADEFLDWLDRVSAAHSMASPTPPELKAAVRKATLQVLPGASAGFVPLTAALNGLFGLNLVQLPEELAQRVARDFLPVTWDMLGPEQRRLRAAEWDYQHDPATEPERERAFELFCREQGIEANIRSWELAAAPTALDLAKKEERLATLRRELSEVQAQQRWLYEEKSHFLAEGRKKPAWRVELEAEQTSGLRDGEPRPEFMPYMKAMAALRERLGATPEELAAWIFISPKDGGIAAYRNANEFHDPPRFYFSVAGEGEFDLVDRLMGTWYHPDDVARYEPVERFIAGQALRARWQGLPGIRVDAFIRAKIGESQLTVFHPLYGGSRWDEPGNEKLPPEDFALVSVTEIEAIERVELGIAAAVEVDSVELPHRDRPTETRDERARRMYERHKALIADGVKNPTAQLAEEEGGIHESRVRQIIGPLRRAAEVKKPASPFAFPAPKATN